MNLKKIDWVTTLFLVLTPLATLILVPLELKIHGLTFTSIFLLVLFWALTSFGITGGYHRYLAHRSYDAAPWVKVFFLLFGGAAFQGSALKWCTDHRRHHRFVDTEKDPYNINKGFWWAHIGWLFVKTEEQYKNDFASDLAKDPLIMFQHKHYALIATVTGFGMPVLLGWAMGNALAGLAFGAFARIVVTHHCTFFINSLCHTWGRRPYSDKHSARDSFLLALFTFGEGYHNFHHEFQADYRNGVRWWQWDPTKWSIRSLYLIGGARKLKRVAPEIILKARMEQAEKQIARRNQVIAERLAALKTRVEHTQAQWRALKKDYRLFKKGAVPQEAPIRLVHMKAELKIARLEFKKSYAQWKTYLKHVQGRTSAA